ncbi:hypothetical protein HanRHA438_Chr12g0546261 [Helianthus annuus]|uniref:Putative CLAVATA3/ESR-RELATED 27 n=1 Tax=Helianthus annuus TaxID=4232 RepID=A0A251TVC2_HELAN|nr:hypothetical protein HanXRQr2_Chr12g0534841 [Helianthus annuus]KAJ0492551.1 hypothetical protein HanIR_Chr12g0576181 [Helianthus annuus]KAJ0725112.1 hypothetical protein HanPI659440_Chr12g0455151 [Helianthus annuus]KAJ0862182.1 hypothetical protein HanPSC8_Chr12g0515171 [Helianthus annuus]KAJ0865946.1 hypothetical protein HanRHA438_Chr12g0546261 [Helianthus annuus]
MSFSGTTKRAVVVFMIIFFVLQATAIRTSPPSAKASDNIKRLELYKRFFNGRFAHLNSTTVFDKSFQEIKRTVPSCPDPLHN